MRPKQKAQQIISKFQDVKLGETGKGLPFMMPKEEAKECAIIAVTEIQQAIGKIEAEADQLKYLHYWSKVKQHIVKL